MTVNAKDAYITLYQRDLDSTYKIGIFTELTELGNNVISESCQQFKGIGGYELDSIKLYKEMYSDSIIAQKVWKKEGEQDRFDIYYPRIDGVEAIARRYYASDNADELIAIITEVLSKVNSTYARDLDLTKTSELTKKEELTDFDSLNLMEDYIASNNLREEVAQDCYAQVNELRNALNLNKRVK